MINEYFQREELIHKIMHTLYNRLIYIIESRYKLYMDNSDFKKAYFNYLNELAGQTRLSKTIQRLSLPYLDSYNDYIDVYIIKNEDGSCTISDDGWTISLLHDDADLTEEDEFIIDLYDITKNEDNSLSITCYPGRNIGYCIHNLVMCMLKIDARHL